MNVHQSHHHISQQVLQVLPLKTAHDPVSGMDSVFRKSANTSK